MKSISTKEFFEINKGLMKDHGRVPLEWLLLAYNNATDSALDISGVLYLLEAFYLKNKLYYRITDTHVYFYPETN